MNGYFALNSVFVQVCLALSVHANKDRHILSAAQIFRTESTFWQYKVSFRLSRKNTLKDSVNAHLEHLFLAFENNSIKLNTDRSIL